MDLKELAEQETTVNQHIKAVVKIKKKKNKDGVYPLKVNCEFGFEVGNPDITTDDILKAVHGHFKDINGLDLDNPKFSKLFGDKNKEEKEEE